MSYKKNKAFTLVELIVVIVILSILATIAFISFGSQSSSARDSTRLSDLANLSKWITMQMTTSWKCPTPDNPINIISWTWQIWYQWTVWTSVLNLIKANSDWFKDPLDKAYYTYSTNTAWNKYQILAFLENKNSVAINFLSNHETKAIEYVNRYPYSKWNTMWILVYNSWSTSIPIQDLNKDWTIVSTTWSINTTTVWSTNSWVVAVFDNTSVPSTANWNILNNWFNSSPLVTLSSNIWTSKSNWPTNLSSYWVWVVNWKIYYIWWYDSIRRINNSSIWSL